MRDNARLEHIFRAYGLSDLQDLVSLLHVLESNNVTSEEFKRWVRQKRITMASRYGKRVKHLTRAERRRNQKIMKRFLPYCPTCNKPMFLRPDPDDDNGSYWACAKCRYSMYDNRSTSAIMREIEEGLKQWQPDANTT